MNRLMVENKSFSKMEMMCRAIKSAKEWQAMLPPQKSKQTSASTKDCPVLDLLPHVSINVSFVYSNAAWNTSSMAGGFGWLGTYPT